MRVSVVVPYRGGQEHRDANWLFLRERWYRLARSMSPNWEVITGACSDGPWVKADAIADALSRATGSILVVADADVWCEGVIGAVRQVSEERYPWAVPHLAVHRLTEAATRHLRDSNPIGHDDLDEQPYEGVVGGGMFVIDRAAYENAPMDRRFKGWGQEDVSAGLAWATLYGQPWRGIDPLWHLWHPPMERMTRVAGSTEGLKLWQEYRRANHNRRLMRELVRKGVEQ